LRSAQEARAVQTYFVQGPPLSPVKIGRAADVGARLSALQVGTPHELRVLLVLDGDREAELHERFARHRIRGEWFAWCQEIRGFIDDNRLAVLAPWRGLNLYCSAAERRQLNEWQARNYRAALALRDWVRWAAVRSGVAIPPAANELCDELAAVPDFED
jgi:hypothetical protein